MFNAEHKNIPLIQRRPALSLYDHTQAVPNLSSTAGEKHDMNWSWTPSERIGKNFLQEGSY